MSCSITTNNAKTIRLFKKETNNNVLTNAHIDEIMRVFDSKENIEYFTRSVPCEEIKAKEYNLSVSSYVEAKDNREVVDITQLNAEIESYVVKINRLRDDIDTIVDKIEGGS